MNNEQLDKWTEIQIAISTGYRYFTRPRCHLRRRQVPLIITSAIDSLCSQKMVEVLCKIIVLAFFAWSNVASNYSNRTLEQVSLHRFKRSK